MTTLVVGIGSDLRSDDRAGRLVAERLAALGLPQVRVRSVIQLTPELAVDVAAAGAVVFVDADPGVSEVTAREVAPAPAGSSAHHLTPAALLALASSLGSEPATAHLVSVPATDFGLGEDLSPIAAAGTDAAVDLITDHLRDGASLACFVTRRGGRGPRVGGRRR